MEWSIQEVSRHAGTTSRTLRHYDDIGLLPPTRIGANGYRYYDEHALVRLQRILLLRDLGLGLPAISEVLTEVTDATGALRGHLAWLRKEHDRLDRQIASVENTISTLERGGHIMAENMFEGFDHTQYKDEVEERWGTEAYATSDSWWRSLSAADKVAWQTRVSELNADWTAAADAKLTADSDEAQALARRHVEWLTSVPGTPGAIKEYVTGLGEMYVADERFASNYGGQKGAEFVRDALSVYAERNL